MEAIAVRTVNFIVSLANINSPRAPYRSWVVWVCLLLAGFLPVAIGGNHPKAAVGQK
jgi:hypothetical protein